MTIFHFPTMASFQRQRAQPKQPLCSSTFCDGRRCLPLPLEASRVIIAANGNTPYVESAATADDCVFIGEDKRETSLVS